METNQDVTQKSKVKKIVFFSLSTLVLGTLTLFGIKKLKQSKTKTNENNQANSNVDIKKPLQVNSNNPARPSLPPVRGNDAFPLTVGSKGSKVRILQEFLIRTYGAGLLPKYGADGDFGSELAAALRAKGYGVPLQESEFKTITEEKKPSVLALFDPPALAKGIYAAIRIQDYNSAITLLKAIGNTTNYSLVSESFKQYYIGGVRQTLVNGMLNVFFEKSQKENTQKVFAAMGLKYDGTKWSLSGIYAKTRIY